MIIHDHFNGSYNCYECGGYCRLSNDNLKVTTLVRWMIAGAMHGRYNLDMLTRDALEQLGVDVKLWMHRCAKAYANGRPIVDAEADVPSNSRRVRRR